MYALVVERLEMKEKIQQLLEKWKESLKTMKSLNSLYYTEAQSSYDEGKQNELERCIEELEEIYEN
jgi:hypothetical protein